MKKSLYATLGVESHATEQEIRLACEAKLAQLDPNDAVRRMAIKEAGSVLGHPQRRAAYDASLHQAAARQRAPVVAEPASPSKLIWVGGLLVVAIAGWLLLRSPKHAPAQVVASRQLTTPAPEAGTTAGDAVAEPAAPAPSRQALTPEALFSLASASVVRVNATGDSGKPAKQGSGVVVEPGSVITNCHVVKGGSRVVVNYRREQYEASVAIADEQHDLCKLAVLGLSAPPIAVGNVASLRVGQKVYAIGSPQGLDLTLSDGMVSSLREGPDGTFIQTTAPISPGSSGGGLFTETGQLVGIVTFQMRSGQNLNFAIPADWIASMAPSTSMLLDRDNDRLPRPARPTLPSTPTSPMMAALMGVWHCFGPLTGRGMDLVFEENNNFSGTFDGRPIAGRYFLNNKQLNLAGDLFQVEELTESRMVMSKGDGRRLACNR